MACEPPPDVGYEGAGEERSRNGICTACMFMLNIVEDLRRIRIDETRYD